MRILFINDLGFQYGAGVAAARQITSFLNAGHTVGMICWEPANVNPDLPLTRPKLQGVWAGICALRHLAPDLNYSSACIAEGLLFEVAKFRPQVIIIGNLHGATWNLSILDRIRKYPARIIAYMHDCYLVSGRCAYPGGCEKFVTSCDHSCPTASEYPPISPSKIKSEWDLRRKLFSDGNIEIATNSRWVESLVTRSIPNAKVATIYLAADETVFRPGDKQHARTILGLPSRPKIVFCSAVNFNDRRKGAHHLKTTVHLLNSEDVIFAGFGTAGDTIPGMHSLGYEEDPRRLALFYQAADLYIGTALEEAFGQTILEAQLSGIPVAAFQTGGIGEIVVHEQTGLLSTVNDTEKLITNIKLLLSDTQKSNTYGNNARVRASAQFSIDAQTDRWEEFLKSD